jgi:tetratricopeptide (TPR) repeat protein
MLVFPLAGALAQNAQIDDFPDAQRRLQEQLERTDDAAYRARIGRLLDSGGDVSYADVLRDPDNIGLNYRFAQTQIRQGNIRGASATLERILLLDPQRPDVRLLYAVVLFRLDNLNDAERELLAVRDVPMSAELRAEVDGLLSQIEQRRRRLRAELLVNFGVQYDWNGNSAQRSNSRLVVDTPLALNDSDERHREISTNGTVQISADYDLGLNRRHKALASVSAYRSEHVHEDQLDLEAGTGQGGLSLA